MTPDTENFANIENSRNDKIHGDVARYHATSPKSPKYKHACPLYGITVGHEFRIYLRKHFPIYPILERGKFFWKN